MHAMGGFLAAALLAVERLVGAVGDRASLVVCQDLGAALGALVKGSAGGATGGAQQQQQQRGSEESGASLIGEWQQRLQNAQEQEQELPGIQQLLPQHSRLAAAATASSSGGGIGGQDGGQLSEDQVLLLRVRELLAWGESQQYSDLMAAARPLRRVVRPGSANSSRSLKPA
jgi:hypothetical protein